MLVNIIFYILIYILVGLAFFIRVRSYATDDEEAGRIATEISPFMGMSMARDAVMTVAVLCIFVWPIFFIVNVLIGVASTIKWVLGGKDKEE